jgi:hypothetical protein
VTPPRRVALSAAAVLGVALFVFNSLVGASTAFAREYSFRVSHRHHSVVEFRLKNVGVDRVTAARLTLGRRSKPLRVARIRRAVRRGILRARLPHRWRTPHPRGTKLRLAERRKPRVIIVTDTTPPETTVTSAPSGTVASASASFAFASSEPGSTFECQLDGSNWSTCSSPTSYAGLVDALHAFAVRAKDAAGNADPTPAGHTWTVDAIVPGDGGSGAGEPLGLTDTFDGSDGSLWVSDTEYWRNSDLGFGENSRWFAEGGKVYRQGGMGRVSEGVFRMWSRAKYTNVRVEGDFVLDGYNLLRNGATGDWGGVKLWTRRWIVNPQTSDPMAAGDGSRVDDGSGPRGYSIEFATRGGHIYFQKKLPGDTRSIYPNYNAYSQFGTYYLIGSYDTRTFTQGVEHHVAADTINNADGSVTLALYIDGVKVKQYVDSGQRGGPPLRTEGRVGVRGDEANFRIDNLTITPTP